LFLVYGRLIFNVRGIPFFYKNGMLYLNKLFHTSQQGKAIAKWEIETKEGGVFVFMLK